MLLGSWEQYYRVVSWEFGAQWLPLNFDVKHKDKQWVKFTSNLWNMFLGTCCAQIAN